MFGRLMRGVAAAAVIFAASSASAQEFSAQRLSDHIRVLASDGMAGRFPGSPEEAKVMGYLQAHYEALGLQPGGPNGQWTQEVDLVKFTPTRAPTISLTTADGATRALTAGTELTLRAGGGDGAVQIRNAPLVFAGYGIMAPERGWTDYGDLDLTGKIVVILGGQPPVMGADPNFFGSTEHKMQEALKRGAIGVLTVSSSDARFQRSAAGMGRDRWTILNADEPKVTGSLNPATLSQVAGADFAALMEKARSDRSFRAVDLGARLTADVAETQEVVRSHNFLAKIPGTTRPDEFVVYSAHWDHNGRAETPDENGDAIYNGAWDNASGTSGVMEMARAFTEGAPPERTVVFLHVTAEERGLLGSQWYSEHPVYPLAKTAADINIDMLPFTPATKNLALFGVGKSDLETDLAALAQAQGGRVITGDGYPEEGFYYRSDHFNFASGGVPAVMPWTALDLVDGGVEAGKAMYEGQMAKYYHQLDDEWRADYDFTAAVQNLDLLYKLGLQVADEDGWPQWTTDEFKPIRAASDDQRQ